MRPCYSRALPPPQWSADYLFFRATLRFMPPTARRTFLAAAVVRRLASVFSLRALRVRAALRPAARRLGERRFFGPRTSGRAPLAACNAVPVAALATVLAALAASDAAPSAAPVIVSPAVLMMPFLAIGALSVVSWPTLPTGTIQEVPIGSDERL